MDLTATPAIGSTFDGWSGGCSGTSLCGLLMIADQHRVATFTATRHTLSVGTTGNGDVTSDDTNITCGSDCEETYDYGTSVTLTATPDVGWELAGWSGGGCSGTGTCTTTVTAAATVTASFALTTHRLTVQTAGSGSVASTPAGISCGGDCDELYDYGTSVTLTATPSTGWLFVGWSGGGCSGTGTCTTTTNAPTTVTATFSISTQTLTVATVGNGDGTVTAAPGAIDCGSVCSDGFDYGTSVTLTATPAQGSTFTGWSGGGCSGTGTCSVTLTAATSVMAGFTLTQHTLTVSPTGDGSVTASVGNIDCPGVCSETLDYGTSVTLTAVAGTGSTFAGWSGGGCSGTGTCLVEVTAASTVSASFTLDNYTLTVALGGAGTGSVSSQPAGIDCPTDCEHDFPYGTMVTLTPSPAVDSMFTSWSGGGCTGRGPCTTTVSAATSVGANFEPLVIQRIGQPTDLGDTYALEPHVIWAQRIVVATDRTLRQIGLIARAYDPLGGVPMRTKMALYTDDAGRPGVTVARTPEAMLVVGPNELPPDVGSMFLPAGTYWIAVTFSPTLGAGGNAYAEIAGGPAVGAVAYQGGSYPDPIPSVWGGPAGAVIDPISHQYNFYLVVD